jgi:histidinol-phosphate/aromatic aminotransferase/cobyric acid decarboxylase-like protein
MIRLFDRLSDLDLVVVDESFIDFADEHERATVADEAMARRNVLVLKSLGKNFGLHGVRLGYGVSNPERVAHLRTRLPHWNVNGLAELVIRELAGHMEEYEQSRRLVMRDRRQFERSLRSLGGLTVFPSQANFVCVRTPEEVDGAWLRDHLLVEHGCLVRACGNKLGSDRHDLRIACRPPTESAALLSALEESLAAATLHCHTVTT